VARWNWLVCRNRAARRPVTVTAATPTLSTRALVNPAPRIPSWAITSSQAVRKAPIPIPIPSSARRIRPSVVGAVPGINSSPARDAPVTRNSPMFGISAGSGTLASLKSGANRSARALPTTEPTMQPRPIASNSTPQRGRDGPHPFGISRESRQPSRAIRTVSQNATTATSPAATVTTGSGAATARTASPTTGRVTATASATAGKVAVSPGPCVEAVTEHHHRGWPERG